MIEQLLAYAEKNGKAWVYWDYAQGGPRARAKPSWTLESTLIGCFTAGTKPQDILDAVEEYQREFKIRTTKRYGGARRMGSGAFADGVAVGECVGVGVGLDDEGRP